MRDGFSQACALNIATGPGTQVRFDWFWLILAVLLDLTHWATSSSATYANRDRIPAYARV